MVYLVWPRDITPAKTTAPDSFAVVKQPQTRMPQARPALSGAEARRVLDEIKRNNMARVGIQFFDMRKADKKIVPSPQFIDLFDLSPDEAGKLADLIQTTRTEMEGVARAQTQVTQIETGGVVIKIPPLDAAPDIYDKVMNGFQSILGNDRYNDMLLHGDEQLEQLFNHFGAEERIFTIKKNADGRYDFRFDVVLGAQSSTAGWGTMSLDGIKRDFPELMEFIPAE